MTPPTPDRADSSTDVLPSALLLQTADVDLPQQALLSGVFPSPDGVPLFAPPGNPESRSPSQPESASEPASEPALDLELELQPQRPPGLASNPTPAEAAAYSTLASAPEHAEDLLADVGFVSAAQRRAVWNGPAAALVVTSGCVVLAAALLLQFALHVHDRLIAAIPAVAPALNALCRTLPCGAGLQRQIDAVVIEGSAFNRRNDHYLFSVDLRSAASVPVATPALELTLTDVQDRPVLRRVLRPAELGAPAELAAGARWSGAVAMQLEPPTNATPDGAAVAGYRLLAFYP